MTTRTKLCTVCDCSKPLEDMAVQKKPNGKSYTRSICRSCDVARLAAWREKNPRKAERAAGKAAKRAREERKNPEFTAKYIVYDSRAADKKKGFPNDLTKEATGKLIKGGCCYCGETSIRMTLDRVDNTKGHLLTNVVPACIRCNYVRGNMPHDAWLIVAEGMRKARLLGLFESWEGRAR